MCCSYVFESLRNLLQVRQFSCVSKSLSQAKCFILDPPCISILLSMSFLYYNCNLSHIYSQFYLLPCALQKLKKMKNYRDLLLYFFSKFFKNFKNQDNWCLYFSLSYFNYYMSASRITRSLKILHMAHKLWVSVRALVRGQGPLNVRGRHGFCSTQ